MRVRRGYRNMRTAARAKEESCSKSTSSGASSVVVPRITGVGAGGRRSADAVAGRAEGSGADPPVREGEVADPVAGGAERLGSDPPAAEGEPAEVIAGGPERLRAHPSAGEPKAADVRAGRAEALRADDPAGRAVAGVAAGRGAARLGRRSGGRGEQPRGGQEKSARN